MALPDLDSASLEDLQIELGVRQEVEKAQKTGNIKAEVKARQDLEAITVEDDPAKGIGTAEAALISLGGGTVKGLRGIRTLFNLATGDDETVKQIRDTQREEDELLRSLKVRSPKATFGGEILGEVAATAPLGLGVGGLVAKQLGARLAGAGVSQLTAQAVPRVTGAITGGALEGGAIGAIQDKTASTAALGGTIGGVAEVILPRIGKVLSKVFQRVFQPDDVARLVVQGADGTPTPSPELAQALDDVGLRFDDIAEEAIKDIPAGEVTAAQTARQQLFESEGIVPAGRSRITQLHDDATKAIQLARRTGSAAADEIRERFFKENEQLTQRFTDTAEELGIPGDVGASVKGALDDLQSNLGSAKRTAYSDLARIATEAGDSEAIASIPLRSEGLIDSITEVQGFIPAGEAKLLDELLARFGLIGDVVGQRGRKTIVDFEGDQIIVRGNITPLTIANTESFRKSVNNILDFKDSRQATAARQVISHFDNMVDDALEGFGSVPGGPQQILAQAKKARQLARTEKLIFDQKDLISRLTGDKPGTNTPLVEASKAFDVIKQAPLEQVNKLISNLRLTPEGGPALGNLQAATVTEFLNSALAASGKKTVGREGEEAATIFSGNSLTKAIDKFGRDKLNSVFRNQPEILKRLSRLEKIGQLRITPDTAVQKGSAPDLINEIMRITGAAKTPGVTAAVARSLGAVRDFSQVRNFRNLAPEQQESIRQSIFEIDDFIQFNAPRLRGVLALATAGSAAAQE